MSRRGVAIAPSVGTPFAAGLLGLLLVLGGVHLDLKRAAISKYFAAEYVQQAYVKYLRRKKHAADFAAAKEAKVVKAGNPMAKSEQ
jgi:hypothetical protein